MQQIIIFFVVYKKQNKSINLLKYYVILYIKQIMNSQNINLQNVVVFKISGQYISCHEIYENKMN